MDQNINNQQPEVVVPAEQQPNSIPPQQVAPQSNRANIILVIILSILILLVLGGIVWIYTKPTPQNITEKETPVMASNSQTTQSSKPVNNVQPIIEMKDWQTFKDDRFDFTFQYPQDWKVVVHDDPTGPEMMVLPNNVDYWSSIGTPPDYADSQAEYMRARQQKGDYSQKSFANFKLQNDAEFNSQYFKDRNITISYEDTTLGGKQALILRTSEIPDYKHIVVYINGVEYTFEIGIKSKDIFDNILKTLRFLK